MAAYAPPMRISKTLVLVLVAGVTGFMSISNAAAQPQTCPAAGADAVVVNVTSPSAGTQLEGRVEVKGRFSGPAPVFQVELFVGDSRKDALDIEPPATSGSFTLAWDTTGMSGGPSTLGVVVCGGDPAAGSLARGTAAVKVEVTATPPPPGAPEVLMPANVERTGPRSTRWVALAMGGPGLLGLGYALGVRPARRRKSPARPPT